MQTTEIKKLLDPEVRRLYEDLNKLMKSLTKRYSDKKVDVYEQYLAESIRYYSSLNLRRYANIWGIKNVWKWIYYYVGSKDQGTPKGVE